MFRNKEVRRIAILFSGISFVVAIAGFKICMAAGILELVTVSILGTVFYVFTTVRYKKIAQLSEQIDMVLHNTEHLCINEADEGELSVLQSEIVKMTLRIREQNDELQREKSILQILLRIFPTSSVLRLRQ